MICIFLQRTNKLMYKTCRVISGADKHLSTIHFLSKKTLHLSVKLCQSIDISNDMC